MANILLAEDEESVAQSLRKWLENDRHKVDLALDGEQCWDLMLAFGYDILILDWSMPRLSGVEVLRRLRAQGTMIPVLILTGKQSVNDKEEAFNAGADDYLTKPFHPRELSARLRALLRRPAEIRSEQLVFSKLTIDCQLRKVEKSGSPVGLQPLEFDLLEFFAKHPNETFSIDTLMQRVWGADSEVSVDAVYACIKRLRKKLDTTGEPTLIKNVFGLGYCFEP